MADTKLPHLVIQNPPETRAYTSTSSGGGDGAYPSRNRQSHGDFLKSRFEAAWDDAGQSGAVGHSVRNGVYIEFFSDPDFDLELKSLENIPKKIRLLSVRTRFLGGEDGVQKPYSCATVYIPNTEKNFFLKKLEDYLKVNTQTEQPRNRKLVESIANIRKAILDSFWSEESTPPPQNNSEWIEVWLRAEGDSVLQEFEALLSRHSLPSREGHLYFPERLVKVIYANNQQLNTLIGDFDYIAEYRKAKTTSAFWLQLTPKEQTDWVQNLLGRTRINSRANTAICILDTGVNNGHPLIGPSLADADCLSFDPNWGVNDDDKHGTLMAGVAIFGDVKKAVESSAAVEINHRLESVKILPPPPGKNEEQIWGYITAQAVSRAEINAPDRKRIICMPVTATSTRDRGKPSSWSAEVDQLAAGVDGNSQRLFILSAGNTTANATQLAAGYPQTQIDDSVHDPAQSWNALSVGAFTQLNQITDPTLSGYTPVAQANELSPFSTTSYTWEDNKWPIKPELVLEGGNLAKDSAGFVTECDDLSMLSTFYKPQEAQFYTFAMTSHATAQLGWMAAQLQAAYPEYWPETIRALLVHNATWPEELKRQFITDDKKTSYKKLLSICGYGVPDLQRSIYSASNSLTLIAQTEIQPFDKKRGAGESGLRTKDQHIYELPWPRDVLLALPDETAVEMRITLSYFVEPGPGEVGWRDRYRYPSHALRFELNSPGETKKEFIKRINKAAREKDEGKPDTTSPSRYWLLGQARDRGSIHSDIWQGTAADLASSNLVAISPNIGWWRERSHLKKWDSKTRYALLISIYTPNTSVDIYTPVAVQLGVSIPVTV